MLDARVSRMAGCPGSYGLSTSVRPIGLRQSADRWSSSDSRIQETFQETCSPDYVTIARVSSAVERETPSRSTFRQPRERVASGRSAQAYALLQTEGTGLQASRVDFGEYTFHGLLQYVDLSELGELERAIGVVDYATFGCLADEQVLAKERSPFDWTSFASELCQGRFTQRSEGPHARIYISADKISELLSEREEVERESPSKRYVESRGVATAGSVTCWDILESDPRDLTGRCSAIEACLLDDPARLARFVSRELGEPCIPGPWRDALVDVAEVLDFVDLNERKGVTDSLLRIALQIKTSGCAQHERVLWAALRTFSSMVAREEAPQLLPFLEPGAIVESRLVALQCTCRIFEHEPPSSVCEHQSLADRACEIAEKYLDPDIFGDGYVAAVAKAAIEVVAVLCDPRLEELVTKVVARTPSWFQSQLKHSLERIAAAWERKLHSEETHAHDGLDRLLRATAELRV